MHTPILHQYPTSPFAEKVRAMLGYKRLAWHSVHVPSVNPKPDLVALTGGYRRVPVLQLGADIYCDTALIADVLDHLAPEPPLVPAAVRGLARTLAQWADGTLFWAAMAYNLQPKAVAQAFAGLPPEAIQAFAADRKAMRVNMTQLRTADAQSAYRSYLRRLASMLDGQAFLLGAQPTVADFAAYHPLWFTRTRVPGMAGILDATPALAPWMDRIAALGHGQATPMSADQALALAAQSSPSPVGQGVLRDSTFQDDHGIALGSQVSITPESFGVESSSGTLLAATRTHYTVAREDTRVGTLHVHFPRVGYVLRQQEL